MKIEEEINIWWEGSFSYKKIIEDKIDDGKYDNKSTDIGLYAVYGNHILYGNDVLLYIGITTEQNFKTRLKDRWIINENNDIKNLKIYLGKIYDPNKTISREIEKISIKKAEALLINVLKPAFNSSYINSINFKKINNEKDFVVFNHNSYKNLLPELSTARWWSFENLNFKLTKKIAEKLNKKVNDDDNFYGFDLETNDNIFVGIDYTYWDKENVPLVIGIYKQSSLNIKELKEEFIEMGEDKEYYYITAYDNLKSDIAFDEILKKILKIEELLK